MCTDSLHKISNFWLSTMFKYYAINALAIKVINFFFSVQVTLFECYVEQYCQSIDAGEQILCIESLNILLFTRIYFKAVIKRNRVYSCILNNEYVYPWYV